MHTIIKKRLYSFLHLAFNIEKAGRFEVFKELLKGSRFY